MSRRRRDYTQRARREFDECSQDQLRHRETSLQHSLVNLDNGSEGLMTSRGSSPCSRHSPSPAVSVSVNHYPHEGYRETGGYVKWLLAILAVVLAVLLASTVKHINIPAIQTGDDDMKDVQDQVLGVKMTIAKLEMAKQEMEEITSQIHFMLNDIRDLASTFAAKRRKHCFDDAKDDKESDAEVSELALANQECVIEEEELIDFALESDGAIIISTGDTENYREPNAITFLGFTICSTTKGPELILQPSVVPGNCWAFRGQHGSVIIQLVASIQVTGITIDHIPKEYSPFDLDSAPKEFSLYGVNGALWSDPKSRVYYGHFVYKISSTPTQYFSIEKLTYPVYMVELRIHNNNGNSDYTCLYRVRIHGILEPTLDCDVEAE